LRHPNGESFPPEVARKLKTYVYRLIDPRNGETFYVGKGQGNRVFAHIHDEQSLEGDDLGNKLRRIRDIRLDGFEVAHVIHRHGMDDQTAFEVESAASPADSARQLGRPSRSTANAISRRLGPTRSKRRRQSVASRYNWSASPGSRSAATRPNQRLRRVPSE